MFYNAEMNICPQDGTPLSQANPKEWPVLELQQNMDQTVQVTLVDDLGQPIKLDTAQAATGNDPVTDDDAVPSPTNQPITIENTSGVTTTRLWMKQHPAMPEIVQVAGTYLGNGVVRLNFTTENTGMPGVFLGDIQLLNSTGKIVLLRRVYVEIEQNTTDAFHYNGPVSVSEVRLNLRDHPEVNTLLEDYEFSSKEIVHCIRKPVDYWNEVPPSIGTCTYQNFPFRFHWIQATISQLILLAQHHAVRNRMQYEADGVMVDDYAKEKEYLTLGQSMWQEYKEFVTNKKREINVNMAWGCVNGGWAY